MASYSFTEYILLLVLREFDLNSKKFISNDSNVFIFTVFMPGLQSDAYWSITVVFNIVHSMLNIHPFCLQMQNKELMQHLYLF